MGNSNFNLRVIRKFHTGQLYRNTGAYSPLIDEAIVIYDQWVYVYAAPELTTLARYRFCIAIATAFEADSDFVPVWENDRRFNADTWPRDGEDAEAISDIRRNWNAYIDSRGDTVGTGIVYAPEGEGED